jgi:hypothetical protein
VLDGFLVINPLFTAGFFVSALLNGVDFNYL